MMTRMILMLAGACVMASQASAAAPVDPVSLGKIDAAIAFCRQVYPDGEPAYNALRASVIGNLSVAAVNALTQTTEYRESLESGSKTLADEPRETALKDCMALVPASGPPASHAHKHK
jgi:hypothetical protein